MSRTREFRRCLSIPATVAAFGLGVSAAAALPVVAQVPTQTPAAAPVDSQSVQRVHVVRPGDTLWDLAATYYGNPYLWKIIYDANKPVVENPHWIYPIEKLIIPGLDRSRGEPLGVPVQSIAVSVIPVQAPDTTPTVLSTVDLRRQVVSTLEYLSAPWLSHDAQGQILGRIARVADPTVSEDKIPEQLYPNARVIVGELRGTAMKPGDSVQIVRMGRVLGTYGRVIEPLGILRIDSIGTAVVTARLVRQFAAAQIGDYIMALPPTPAIARGDLAPVSAGAEGTLLEFLETEPMYGAGALAFVSFGADKLRIGDELSVYTPEHRIDNERPDIVPAQTVGVVRVVKVSDHSATVRVTGVRNTGFRNGLPARLVRRAP